MRTSMKRTGSIGTMVSVAAFVSAFSVANAAMADADLVFVSDFYDKNDPASPGDPGQLGPEDAAYQVSQLIQQAMQSTTFTAVLATEVNNRTGTYTEYTGYINDDDGDVWAPFKSITRAVPGNHDWLNSAAGFKQYFGVTTTYSSFTTTVGSTTWKIIGLDTNLLFQPSYYERRKQYYFLARELAHESAEGAQCTIAYFHHPRWSSGEHRSQAAVDTIWRMLADNNVELALSGHDHNYERFWPKDADGNRVDNGVTQVVAGIGGAELREAPYEESGRAVLIDTYVDPPDIDVMVEPGALAIHLYESWAGYLVMYFTASGALLDYWWGDCY